MILNLGCGARTSPRCINIDRSIHMRIAQNAVLFGLARLTLSRDRVQHLEALRMSSVLHDLAKGIPYPNDFADAIYHSYVLQHIDRDLKNPAADHAASLLKECHRVLKRGGILRIVVPDFEMHCRRYIAHLDRCRSSEDEWARTDDVLSHLIGMEVRKEAFGTSHQTAPLRKLENLFLGDARKRGETHQWEYDQFNLSTLLKRAGFSQIERCDYLTSLIPSWNDIGLDRASNGEEYKAASLYIEAVK